MTDLAGRGPIGQKQPKPPKKSRKPVRKISAKRAAYLASAERKAALAHMGRIARLPCMVCGARPVEVHHLPDPRSDWRVIPLCPPHHRREFGEQSYHYSPRAFHALHGDAQFLLAKVRQWLDAPPDIV